MSAEVNKAQRSQNTILSTLLDATGDLDTAEALQKSLSAHWLQATTDNVSAIDQTARDLHSIQLVVQKELDALKPLQTFCIDELTRALSGKWSAVFDVEKDLLSMPGVDCGCPATSTDKDSIQTIPHATQTLLQAAMQNFSEDEAAGTFPEGSLVRVSSAPAGVDGLTPASFAKFCRELDLGKRYQEHFQQVLGLCSSDDKVTITRSITRDIAKMKRLLLQLDMHLAVLKDHLTPTGLQMLRTLIDADGVVSPQTLRYNKRPLIMQGIEILDSCVWGVVVFSARSVELYPDEWCLVYMAGEPQRPLYEYSSFTAFKQYLTQQLKVKSYKDYFANSIDEDDKADFFKSVADSADLGHVKQLPIAVPLFEFMLQSHVGKLQLDARKLAVPTADIDEEVRQKRLLDFLQLGVTVASVAGFVVPVLGQLMMGVAVGQLLSEVYEGVEDWRRGDHQKALSHLLSVVENIAQMVAFAGGQKALGALGKKLLQSHPAFFGEFTAIINHAGQPRLWKPDLSRYEHFLPTGLTVAPSSEEFYQIGAKTMARVDHRFFAGPYDSAAKVWRLEHAERAQAYVPELVRHVEGGWRLPAEEPQEWGSSAYTLKRIDPQLSEFVDTDLDMMRRLSDTSPETLHQAFTDNLSLPVRLRETVERARVSRQLQQLTRELQNGETHSGQPVEAQLHALPKMSGWPTDRYIEVTDAEGTVTATYPQTKVLDESLAVVVSEEQLAHGQLLQSVVDGLYQKEVDTLLGGKVARSVEESTLAKKLGALLQADHRAAFERMYQRYDRSDVDDVLKLRHVFPDIPARYAKALIERAPSVQRLHLRKTGRVPLRLGQEVSDGIGKVRLDRALAGFHWPGLANADTDRLAIQLLPRLSGWDSRLRLELRDKTLSGPILQALGDTSALPANTCSLVKSAEGYEAFGGDGKTLGKVASGPDALYEAILKALPRRQRTAIGLADPEQASTAKLRSQLLNAALDDRKATARTLVNGKPESQVAEPACIQGDQPPAVQHPPALMRKVCKLFPRLSKTQASEFIDGLGDDQLTRATRVNALRRDLESLREALFLWSEDTGAMNRLGGDLAEVRHSRKTMAELIENGFRRYYSVTNENGKLVGVLNFDGMRVGKLPTLPPGISFDHIQKLFMNDMALDDDVAYFLKSFKKLESLELDRNAITRLPEVLSHMPDITRLCLAGNKLQLTEYTLAKLSGLRSLHHLNLNENPLNATPDVRQMFNLRRLLLQDTGLTEIPKGLEYLLYLDWVDLRSNKIKNLPHWLFQTPRRFSQALDLGLNPLADPSKTQLENYRNNFGVGMGYLENDIPRMNEQQARSLWLADKTEETGARRERIWNAFNDDPRAESLFHLLAELGDTADSEKVNKDMRRRVWAVLEAAEADTELCDQILSLAATPINCNDSAAMNFSYLEVAVEVDRVTRLAGNRITSVKPLLELGRGLFRLEQLNEIARAHAAKVPTVDPLEVNLAYRIGLAETLELPGQPRNMLFGTLGGVTAADLDVAKHQVATAELSPKWLQFMSERTFWRDYLERTLAHQFSFVRDMYDQRMTALDEKKDTMSSVDYLSQSGILKVERQNAIDEVMTRLTANALRDADLGICTLADG